MEISGIWICRLLSDGHETGFGPTNCYSRYERVVCCGNAWPHCGREKGWQAGGKGMLDKAALAFSAVDLALTGIGPETVIITGFG